MRPLVPVWRRWRRIARSTLLCGSLAAALATTASPGEASAGKLWKWINRWLGNPPIATGGTRGEPPPPAICLLHPWLLPQPAPPRDGLILPPPFPRADLAVSRPVLATTTPLSKIRLREGNGRSIEATPPHSAKTSGTQMAWPSHWPSLAPGRLYQLKLVAASTGDGQTIELQTASAEAFEQVRSLQERLGSDPAAWDQQIQALLASGGTPSNANRALAAQLLFSEQAPPSPSLEQLHKALRRNNCTTPSGARPPGAPP